MRRFGNNAKDILLDINRLHLIDNEIFEKEEVKIQNFIASQNSLIEAFNYAPTKNVQTQILSIIPVDFTVKTIKSVIPVTEYQIKKARNHANVIGKEFIFENKTIFRTRI